MTNKRAVLPAFLLASVATLTLAACESSGNYRVGWVGNTPPPSASSSGGDPSSSGGTSTGGTSTGGTSTGGTSTGGTSTGGTSTGGASAPGLLGGLIVTAGNTVIGAAGTTDGVIRNGVLPTAGVVTGVVTGVLEKTGQTLVKLGEGTGGTSPGVILDGVGGTVGALVGIDLGKGSVVSAPAGSKSLIGLNVLAANPNTGQLATVSALSGGKLLAIDVNKLGQNGGVLGTGLLAGGTGSGGNGGVLGTGLLASGDGGSGNGGLLGTGLLAPATPSTPAPAPTTPAPAPQPGLVGGIVQSTVNTVGGLVNGLTGGLLAPKKK